MLAHADTKLRINLDALVENYNLLASRMQAGECGAVVKSNAYGLGVHEVAVALNRAGCKRFFVATLDEGMELRAILPEATIYIFHGVGQEQETVFFEYKLIPVLNSPEQVMRWEIAAGQYGRLPAILHIDTGMNRLGVSLEQAESIMKGVASQVLDFEFIMSHLACADIPEHPLNNQQLKQINAARHMFPGSGISFANSSGLFLDKSYHFDLARPGAALYGINPTSGRLNPMKNVVTLMSKAIQIRTIDTNTTVGYAATCELARGSTVATVPVGYADGYLRSLSNCGKVIVAGHEAPIVGRISMDLMTVDLSNIPEAVIREGMPIEIMGEHLSVDEVAKAADTNGYEILTRIGRRCMREYIGGA
jgi:alanine racemase